MKNLVASALAVLTLGIASAADSSTLKFGGERIGVPPLSLAESLAQSAKNATSPDLGTGLPRLAPGSDSPSLSPQLVPRVTPSLKQLENARAATAPRVSRASGMPILEPSDAVDYKMTIVPPDPTIDFKLAIKNPMPADPAPTK